MHWRYLVITGVAVSLVYGVATARREKPVDVYIGDFSYPTEATMRAAAGDVAAAKRLAREISNSKADRFIIRWDMGIGWDSSATKYVEYCRSRKTLAISGHLTSPTDRDHSWHTFTFTGVTDEHIKVLAHYSKPIGKLADYGCQLDA
jgi:hypothetical protein